MMIVPWLCANTSTVSSTNMSSRENLPIYDKILKKRRVAVLCFGRNQRVKRLVSLNKGKQREKAVITQVGQ